MKMHKLSTGLVLVSAMLLNGCGGGSAGIEGGIGGTGAVVSSGTVTGFGSVFVNGVEFHTNGADIVINGQTFTDDRLLREGMVVQVSGSFDDNGLTGNATAVTFEKSLEGPVTAVATDSITVMGITVSIDGNTCVDFTGTDCTVYTGTGITTSHFAEVSGFQRPDGSFYASYIEIKASDPGAGQHSLHGTVATAGATSFTINGLTVSWSGTPSVTAGDFVEVHGTYAGASVFNATGVEIKNLGFSNSNIDRVEVEGVADDTCDSGTIPCEFTMQGYTIRVVSTTDGGGGMTAAEVAAEIRAGSKVEAEGSVSGNVMTAHEIKFKDEARIEAVIAGITGTDPVILTFADLQGIEATVESTDEINGMNFVDITTGMSVRLRGRVTNGMIDVSRIDDRGNSTTVMIRGLVESIANPNVTVLGTTVDTSGLQFRREISSGNSVGITSTEFFATVQPRDIVSIKGDYSTANIWEQVEIDK